MKFDRPMILFVIEHQEFQEIEFRHCSRPNSMLQPPSSRKYD